MKKATKSYKPYSQPKYHRLIGNRLYSITSDGKQGTYYQTIIDENEDGYFYISIATEPDQSHGTATKNGYNHGQNPNPHKGVISESV